ncbi:class I SAM-dependent methyltransferase [Maribellus sp. YY47]|uniref:class I SAM-dependent methyltransferase n=1 Tax=Maribellus sp. YY47 TaxID=2929486 RepID=UPI00200064A7|nr:class I SAM-dependent methyltransferase [Maribellus sp. YY47]MCK3683741.1 methyltransferase domain-containing protein [Maribellus sp. YY47]
MHDRHRDKWQYFNEQAYTTKKYVIPYIQKHRKITQETTVLEIGCGEGGNLLPFMELGCKITGIDLSKGKIEKGIEFFSDHTNRENLTLIADNIYNRDDLGVFDVIILRDVIEHIPDQNFFMAYFKCFFHAESIVYFGFPPWQNPFGGHQQMCTSKILSKSPYFHLLPVPLYRFILKLFEPNKEKIKEFLEIKETGISIERFETFSQNNGFKILNRTLFLINPNYEIKFKLNPRIQLKAISAIPYLRNYFSTCAYYLLRKE